MQEQNLDHNIGKYHKQQHMHDLILGKRDTILYQVWKLAFVIRLTFHRTLLGTIFLAGITFLPLILKGSVLVSSLSMLSTTCPFSIISPAKANHLPMKTTVTIYSHQKKKFLTTRTAYFKVIITI